MPSRGSLSAAGWPGLDLTVRESVARRAVAVALQAPDGVVNVRAVFVHPAAGGLDVECAATVRDDAKAAFVVLDGRDRIREALRCLGLRLAGMRLTIYRFGMADGQFYQLRL